LSAEEEGEESGKDLNFGGVGESHLSPTTGSGAKGPLTPQGEGRRAKGDQAFKKPFSFQLHPRPTNQDKDTHHVGSTYDMNDDCFNYQNLEL
jgi:hypothetical protein